MDEKLKKSRKFCGNFRRYCVWAESPFGEIDVEMQTAQMILAELNYFVLDLPDDDSEDDIKLEDVSTEQWKVVQSRFKNLPVDGYWTIFDPSKVEENEAVFTELIQMT